MLVLCELVLKYGGTYFASVVQFFSFLSLSFLRFNSLTFKK